MSWINFGKISRWLLRDLCKSLTILELPWWFGLDVQCWWW